MKKNNEAIYPGSIAVLYNKCLLAWNLYLKHWQAFKDLNEKYTQTYGEHACRSSSSQSNA